MGENDLDSRIDILAQWLYESQYPVIFTGAGISTDSGIQDFRGPDGVWTRRDKGLPPKKDDIAWDSVDPNICHYAIVELQNIGKMGFLISQNVDNLHVKSGIRYELLAELHGNISRLRCDDCGETVEKTAEGTPCTCGGKLAPSVVGFGMAMPQKDTMESYQHSRNCDLFIVIGSSLVVSPAADMPVEALGAGAKLVIINDGETPVDRYCNLRFEERIGEVFPVAVERLKVMMDLENP